jgi:hypothetical protein
VLPEAHPAVSLSLALLLRRQCPKPLYGMLSALNEKGCIIVRERSNRGHLTEVRLPSEIPDIVVLPAQNVVLDIDKIDFFSDRRFLNALLER